MPTIPTPLILVPLLMAMVAFFLRFYKLDPEENVRNPNFIAGAVCVVLSLVYLLVFRVALRGNNALASVLFFAVAVILAAAAIRVVMRARSHY